MASTTPSALLPTTMQAEDQLKATVVEEMPIDGAVEKPIEPAYQNAFLLVVFPIALMVVGAIVYLAKRGSPGSPRSGAEKGGLWCMAVGGLLAGLMLVYLMLAQ